MVRLKGTTQAISTGLYIHAVEKFDGNGIDLGKRVPVKICGIVAQSYGYLFSFGCDGHFLLNLRKIVEVESLILHKKVSHLRRQRDAFEASSKLSLCLFLCPSRYSAPSARAKLRDRYP